MYAVLLRKIRGQSVAEITSQTAEDKEKWVKRMKLSTVKNVELWYDCKKVPTQDEVVTIVIPWHEKGKHMIVKIC